MKQLTMKEQLSHFEHLHTTGLAYELIREILIPDLLGKELPSILYWSGKNIARKYPVTSEEEIKEFFRNAGWGDLSVVEIKSNGVELELRSDFITARNQSRKGSSYQLEAGFLAQQFEQLQHLVTEAYEDQNKRSNIVHFTVKWDKKDPIE
ncbi:YslB family protein [Bacillus sp. DJP31]|uniref:YslB family protein n=1 Tax=Bacillus sp. DJP31 TaxID=3409789 RepID=UPI003BB6A635